MITMLEIRSALVDLLQNKAGFQYEIHFDNVKESSESYFFIDIRSRRNTFDPVYYERSLTIDIQLRLLPDENDRIHRSELYEAADRLDMTIRPVIQIKDRFITVQEVKNRIYSDILHYEFKLEFADYLPEPQPEKMQELELVVSTKRPNTEKGE